MRIIRIYISCQAQSRGCGHGYSLAGTASPLQSHRWTLRPAQFSVLALIDANPSLPQSILSAALGIQRPNFVALLDELESRGLTKRCVSPQDRRIKTLTLTVNGRRVLRRAIALHSAHEARFVERLGARARDQLALMLSSILADGLD